MTLKIVDSIAVHTLEDGDVFCIDENMPMIVKSIDDQREQIAITFEDQYGDDDEVIYDAFTLVFLMADVSEPDEDF